ncbi:hypothetical protein KAJ27_20145 [bacterium]|nr:hypothetical protein [bacterium]
MKKILTFLCLTLIFSLTLSAAQLQLDSPKDKTVFSSLRNVTLKWQDIGAPGYKIYLWKDTPAGKEPVQPMQSITSTYTIPSSKLAKDTLYLWQVQPVGSFSGTKSSPTYVFTIGKAISAQNTGDILFNYKDLCGSFNVNASGSKVILPPGLVDRNGKSEAVVSGGKVRLRFDLAKLFDPSKPMPVTVSSSKTLQFSYDKAALGKYIGAHDCGFDIYTDTPNFDNWSGTALLTGGGTCLGVVFTVKNFFESMDYGTSNGINILNMKAFDFAKYLAKKERFCAPDSQNMREFSVKHDKVLHKYMEYNHMDNLNPTNLDDALKGMFNFDNDQKTFKKYCEDLDDGKPALLSMFKHSFSKSIKIPIIGKKLTFNKPEAGHAMMVYRVYEFEKNSLMCIYDPNILYKENSPKHSAITFDSSKKHGAFKYLNENWPSSMAEYKSFAHMKNSRFLFAFTGMIAESWSKVNDIVNDVVDKVKSFVAQHLPKISLPKLSWPF